jgi:glycosidase
MRAWLLTIVLVGCASARPSAEASDAAAPAVVVDAGAAEDVGAPPMGDAAEEEASVPAVPFSEWRKEPIYELYVRHFSQAGNFAGVTEKLPELKALGVGIVWLLPIHEIGSIVAANGGQATDAPYGNPYAVKAYERLNAEYGSDDDFRALVRAAHGLGMHVLVDWVPNHTAWDNHLVTEHPDWYVRKNGVIQPVVDFPWIAQLDWSSADLRDYMTNVMVDWIRKYDFDGFRIDYAHGMPIDFFSALRPKLEAAKPVFLLAEAGDVAFHPAFDMTYDWNVYPLFGDVASGAKPVSAIDDVLLNTQLLPYATMPDALVMRMTYNHDDNGNFTLQDRYRGGIKTFAVLAATLPGKPLVFDGQEVGMNVFDGSAIRPSIPLGHDPKVKIVWTDSDGYRPFYTKLLQLHRANSALSHTSMADFRKITTTPADRPYAFVRRDGANTVLVILNLGDGALRVTLSPAANVGAIDGDYVELFSGKSETVKAGDALDLAPWEYRVYVQGPTG